MATPKKNGQYVTHPIQVDHATWRTVRKLCVREQVSARIIIRDALRVYLALRPIK